MTDVEERNYYELLGVTPKASEEEIRASYIELARIFHPDSNFFTDIIEGQVAEQADTFKLITEAYRTLNDTKKRADYDSTLSVVTREWGETDRGQAPLQVLAADFQDVGRQRVSPLVDKVPPRKVFSNDRRASRMEEIRNVPSVLDLCHKRRGFLGRVLGKFGL